MSNLKMVSVCVQNFSILKEHIIFLPSCIFFFNIYFNYLILSANFSIQFGYFIMFLWC